MSESLLTARDFLKAASDFEQMTPERNLWSEESLESNPPRLVRLQRLHAFAKAFDVQPGFEALWSGDFIGKRPFERYAPLLQRVQNDLETVVPDVARFLEEPMNIRDIRRIYERLFQFLSGHAYPMLNMFSGTAAASGFSLYAIYRVGHVLSGVSEVIRPIEELAGLIVEPEGRSFTEKELTEHGWPKEDPSMLDAGGPPGVGRRGVPSGRGRSAVRAGEGNRGFRAPSRVSAKRSSEVHFRVCAAFQRFP